MDELEALCERMLGDPRAAARARQAAGQGDGDRLATLRRAVTAWRNEAARATGSPDPDASQATEAQPSQSPAARADRSAEERSLAEAVAGELAAASARLTPAQREALALSDLVALGHRELGSALGLAGEEIAPLLAGARIELRAQLRGAPVAAGDCPERERTLRVATLRQDGEPVADDDQDWLFEHLGRCQDCARAHSAMHEGAACYRAWRQ